MFVFRKNGRIQLFDFDARTVRVFCCVSLLFLFVLVSLYILWIPLEIGSAALPSQTYHHEPHIFFTANSAE